MLHEDDIEWREASYPLDNPMNWSVYRCGCGERFEEYWDWREHANGEYPDIISAEDNLHVAKEKGRELI